MISHALMMEAMDTLEAHTLDCTCELCAAYTSGSTPHLGLIAAATVIAKRKGILATQQPPKYLN